jgi:CHAD domain-containing protein
VGDRAAVWPVSPPGTPDRMSHQLAAQESISDALKRTSSELLREAERALSEEVSRDQTHAVHAARKAIKQERALLRLMRDAVPAKRRRRENAALRAAARRLSDTRDAAVMLATLDGLAERYSGQVPHSVYEVIKSRLRAERPVFSDLSDAGPETAAAAELSDVRRRIEAWPVRGRDTRVIAGGLHRTYRDARRAMRAATRRPTDDALHTWRKRTKDLWYELRFVRDVCGEMAAGQAREAHRLADLLGDDHDLAVLDATLRRLAPDAAADVDAVIGLLEHRRHQLQAEARLLGGRVYAEPPDAFARRIGRLWKAGQRSDRTAEAARPAELAGATRASTAG